MYATPLDVEPLAERLGITSFARTTVRRLSGGQRQRLALAAAIIGRPELVFLDEPSAGMDPQSRHAVWDLVRELRSEGVSIVLTTHLMDEAEDLADNVVIVDGGAVIAQGSVRELTSAVDDSTLRFSAAPDLDMVSLARALSDGAPQSPDGVHRVQHEGDGDFTVSGSITPATVAALADWCASHDFLVSRLSIGRRTLEDVFLDLTGRSLR